MQIAILNYRIVHFLVHLEVLNVDMLCLHRMVHLMGNEMDKIYGYTVVYLYNTSHSRDNTTGILKKPIAF